MSTVFGVLAASAVFVVSVVAGEQPGAGAGGAAAGVTLTAYKVAELRERELVKPAQEGDAGIRFKFSMMGITAGLRVTLHAKTPEGLRVIGVEQPKEFKATDSAGTDLTRIEPNFHDEREYLKIEGMGSPFDEDRLKSPQEITLTLTQPKRAATSVDISGEARLLVGGPPRSVKLEAAKAWTKLDIPEFAGLNALYRVKQENNQTEIEFKSDNVEPRIDEVLVVNGEDKFEANGWSSMNEQLSYTIDAPLEKTGHIELRVFRDAKYVVTKIELKGLALP